jgi:hypothetical protein
MHTHRGSNIVTFYVKGIKRYPIYRGMYVTEQMKIYFDLQKKRIGFIL